MLKENYQQAINYFQKALDDYFGIPAEKGDFKYHLGEALFRNGQKGKAKKIILEGLREIQQNSKNVDPFLIHVWESGAKMKLAELLKEENPQEAKHYLAQAQIITNSDPKLVIRKRQIEKLAKNF